MNKPFSEYNSIRIKGVFYNKENLLEWVENEAIPSSEEWLKNIGLFLNDWLNPNPHIFVKTSGSTGKPKSIYMDKQKMIHSALATGDYFDLKPKDKALLCLPANFIAGKMMIIRAMVLDLDLFITSPKGNPFKEINEIFDFVAMVPLQVDKIIDAQMHQIRKLIIGGAAISSKLQQKILKVETQCFATYGMTETITHIAVKKLNKINDSNQYYEALKEVEFSLDNRNCLVINAPRVNEDKVVTNDVVRLISPNKFEWLGRWDNVINSGGLKIHPEKIEEKIISLIQQRHFIYSRKHDTLGEEVILILEGELTKNDQENIYQQLGNVLTKYEMPRKIFNIRQFLETPNGKLKRKETYLLLKQ